MLAGPAGTSVSISLKAGEASVLSGKCVSVLHSHHGRFATSTFPLDTAPICVSCARLKDLPYRDRHDLQEVLIGLECILAVLLYCIKQDKDGRLSYLPPVQTQLWRDA